MPTTFHLCTYSSLCLTAARLTLRQQPRLPARATPLTCTPDYVKVLSFKIGIPWLSLTYAIKSKNSSLWQAQLCLPSQPQIPTLLPPGHANLLPVPMAHCAFPCCHFSAHPVILCWILPKDLRSWQTLTWSSNLPSQARSFVKSSLKPSQM